MVILAKCLLWTKTIFKILVFKYKFCFKKYYDQPTVPLHILALPSLPLHQKQSKKPSASTYTEHIKLLPFLPCDRTGASLLSAWPITVWRTHTSSEMHTQPFAVYVLLQNISCAVTSLYQYKKK